MRVLELLLPAGLTLRGLLRWVLLPQPYTERVKRKLQDYGRKKKIFQECGVFCLVYRQEETGI